MKKMGFDMFDNVTFKTFAIRLGKVGIIADFLENGVHYKNFADEYREYRALELHPDQFREMAARIFYTSSLIHLETSVEFFEDGVSLLWAPNRDEGFAKWNTRDYARVLAHCWQKELDAVYISPDSVWTLLRNPDGSLRHAPAFDPPKSFVAKTKKRKGASS